MTATASRISMPFDPARLLTRLASEPALPVFKETLKDLRAIYDDAFNQQTPIRELVHGRAIAMDALLQCAWTLFDWQGDKDIALIAVGGYGRGELLPHSDIDLLFIFKDNDHTDTNVDAIQSFLTLLWDIKLDIGHSVRTIESCVTEAQTDVTITTNLLETRTLVGNDQIRLAISEAVSAKHIWPSAEFYTAKTHEQAERYKKFNETEYNLEPNVKGGPGGLRDIQTIGWVAKRHFGDTSLTQLVSRGFLTDAEYEALLTGQDFLWRVRYALHMSANREEDRLLFNLQEVVAELFGYEETDGLMAVEQLMQDYFQHVFRLRTLNILLLQLFDEAILSEESKEEIIEINSRFQVRNQYIEVTNDQVFNRSPSALMEIFVLWAQTPDIKGIRASTIRLILDSRSKIDGAFRQDLRNITFFMELLRSPQGVYHGLLKMNQYGVLGLYLPEFGQVVGQMQFDLFHVYTVDAHTLMTIRNLRSFRHANNTEQFPIATRIIHTLPKVELAYIAALYHDIGKGRQSDHSQEGALEVQRFAHRHRLSGDESDLVTWLVLHHLLMSITSQREDISDPEVITHFAQQVGTPERLDYLYVLTAADISATNPKLWNSWRASLLERLYNNTKQAFRRGLDNPLDRQDLIDQKREEAILLLKASGFEREDIIKLWDNPGDDYFLRESAQDIAWQTEAIAEHGLNKPLVLIKETQSESYAGGTQLFVYAPDRAHLFTDIAATLDMLNLDIQDARIMTSSASNFSLDTFIVLEQDGGSIGDNPERLATIQSKLLSEIQNPNESPTPNRRISRQQKHFTTVPEINISNDVVNQRTIVDISSPDRPGLLADIGRCFKRQNLIILNARIATMGGNIEDVFFVVDENHQPLQEYDDVVALQKDLLSTISEVIDR